MSIPFFSFEDLPPEAQERIKKQHDMHHMQHQFALHSINQLFDELKKEQLQTVRMLIESATGSSDSGNHYLGRITQVLHDKHDICSCGEDHAEEHADLTKGLYTADGERVTDHPHPGKKEVDSDFPVEVRDPNDPVMQAVNDVEQREQDAQNRQYAMEAYNVYDVPASGGKVVCREEGCGTQWPDLDDRMKGKPGKGGCPQCAYREAWG